MKSNKLSVSIIIPVYNGARFLAEAIESIYRQYYEPIEIIIVDDGSTDETPNLIAHLGQDIHYIRQPNQGPAAARNRGLKLANGELIAFLDADDLWPDEKLISQAGYLTVNPSIQFVQGLIQEIRLENRFDDSKMTQPQISKPYFNVNLGSFLFRRTVFDAIGSFDETLRQGEDMDFVIRAWENGLSKARMNSVALIYQKHRDNMTNGVTSQLLFTKLFKKYLDRCRESNPTLPQRPNIAGYIGWDKNQRLIGSEYSGAVGVQTEARRGRPTVLRNPVSQ
jgi:glycosyltransferase involved in cell wall biosynthesis